MAREKQEILVQTKRKQRLIVGRIQLKYYVTYLCIAMMLDKNGKAREVIRFADS